MGLRILFMGTPDFSVEVLDRIIKSGYQVVAVVTMPDKPAGRGLSLIQSPVKEYAMKNGLPLLQPVNLKSDDFFLQLQNLKPDVQIVVAFRMLPERVWNFPSLGTYNLHASLLPHYRGAAPINWAIINGEKFTGITTFKLQHEIDTGSILLQEKVEISETMNAGELHDLLMVKGADLVVESLRMIEEGDLRLINQNELLRGDVELKHAPKLFKEDCRIDFNKNVIQVNNFIRGLSPFPVAWCFLRQKGKEPISVKIYSAGVDVENDFIESGNIKTNNKDYLKVGCSDGFILVHEIQLPGKKRMNIRELLNGFKFNDDDYFT